MKENNEKLINYERVEGVINTVETILEEFDLEEKQLILKFLGQRIGQRVAKQKANDIISSNPLASLALKMMPKKDKEEDDTDNIV